MSARQPWHAVRTGICIRGAIPGDGAALAEFLAAMDRDGLYERHFAHGEAPNQALLDRMAGADGRDRVVLLAVGANGTVIGHAEYVAEGGAAEFALMVLPGWRDCGTGKALLAALMSAAVAAGQREMHGLILSTNTRALMVARRRGFRLNAGDDARTVIVSRALAPERAADPPAQVSAAPQAVLKPDSHDPDRTPLYRCPGP